MAYFLSRCSYVNERRPAAVQSPRRRERQSGYRCRPSCAGCTGHAPHATTPTRPCRQSTLRQGEHPAQPRQTDARLQQSMSKPMRISAGVWYSLNSSRQPAVSIESAVKQSGTHRSTIWTWRKG
jgi:hypothetical protein